MNIIFLVHPGFLASQSMPRFNKYLVEGMRARGHNVKTMTAKARVSAFVANIGVKKWAGYIDQFVLFPFDVRRELQRCSPDTLFVITDQALSPWMSLIHHRKHVVHCHDFLAQNSALGNIPYSTTSRTGKWYQSFIRRGFRKASNFISVSQKTQSELHGLLTNEPKISAVVYNGFTQPFNTGDATATKKDLSNVTGIDLSKGFILHVGGNQWYKNRVGVIQVYNAWRSMQDQTIPLLLVGSAPDSKLTKQYDQSLYKADIHFLRNMSDDFVRRAYNAASVLLFPSLAEGFGWPIAEAMASGCLVITTEEAPMTEVAGKAGFYIPRSPIDEKEKSAWALLCGKVLDHVLTLPPQSRVRAVQESLCNARRFDSSVALTAVEKVYEKIVNSTV